jgi:hypothetical protein
VKDWGTSWTPERDSEDDSPAARYAPRRRLAEILDEARGVLARAEQPASGSLIMLGETASGPHIDLEDADVLANLQERVARREYPVAVLVVRALATQRPAVVTAQLQITLLSDFAEDEELEKNLITAAAGIRRSVENGTLRLSGYDPGEPTE